MQSRVAELVLFCFFLFLLYMKINVQLLEVCVPPKISPSSPRKAFLGHLLMAAQVSNACTFFPNGAQLSTSGNSCPS